MTEEERIKLNKIIGKGMIKPEEINYVIDIYKKYINKDTSIFCLTCPSSVRALIDRVKQI